MSLKRATLLVLIGLSVTFLFRFVGTIYPGFFRHLAAARISVLIYLLAGLFSVLFYYLFYRDSARKGQEVLKNASKLAVVGSAVGALVHVKALVRIFFLRGIPGHLLKSHLIEVWFPAVSLVTALIFFYVLREEAVQRGQVVLEKAARAAIIGFFVFLAMHTVVVFNFVTSGHFRWLAEFSKEIAIVALPFAAFGLVCIMYFFWVFYRLCNDENGF